MKRFLNFDWMMMPLIIKLLFWLFMVGSMIGGFVMIGLGLIGESGNFLFVFIGIGVILFGPIIGRLYCEMLIVIFKMQSSLVQIRDLLEERPVYEVEEEKELIS